MFEMTLARLKSYKDESRIIDGLEIVGDEAFRRCPVDTGRLSLSWEIVRKRGGHWSITFNTEYAVYVHENLDVYHKNGEAKFLENAWAVKKNDFLNYLVKK